MADRALAVQAASVASPVSVLLVRRHEIAERLDLIEPLVAELAIVGVVAALAARWSVRTRDTIPAGGLLFVCSVLASAGLGLMAWTIEVGLFTAGALLLAAGTGPALVIPRIILMTTAEPDERLGVASRYWSAVAAGLAWPLGLEIVADPAETTVLWLACALAGLAALLLLPAALAHDEDVRTEPMAGLLDVPWVRRSTAAAFGAGVVLVGGAEAARDLLAGEWQRSPEQTAAVLAVGPAAALLALSIGHWYHRLDRLAGGRRADAIGIQLIAVGTLVFIGGLSFTYIGLVVSWAIAGAAAGLAAAGLDAAVFAGVRPDVRRIVAWRQVRAFAAGGAAAALVNALVIGGWSDQWKIALTGVPLVVVGFLVRRYAESSADAVEAHTAARAATVPRRVAPHDDGGPMLRVEGLDVSYGSVQVLFGVDLEVGAGEVVALLGTNGAGKTTLLRAISGLEPTRAGRVLLNGLDITRTRPTWRVNMGLHQIVGGAAVVPDLTVAENLRLFGHAATPERRETGIAESLEVFPRLAERGDQPAATLSGGEKQMLALAKAIIVPPRLLLIDEFSLGLAPKVVGELLPVVRRIAEWGSSVLMVEQSVNVALSIADRAAMMEKGEIGYVADAADLRDRPDLLQAAYLQGLSKALED